MNKLEKVVCYLGLVVAVLINVALFTIGFMAISTHISNFFNG